MKKILVVVTSCGEYRGTARPTGLWLGEFVHFYNEMKAQGCEIEVASPLGGKTPIDPASLGRWVVDDEIRAFQKDPKAMALLADTRQASDLRAEDYAALYFTGGHGTMWDFPEDTALQSLTRQLFESGGWVTAVCHGVAGLLDVKLGGGEYLVAGKKLTGYSQREELVNGTGRLVPYSLEGRLRERGADYARTQIPFLPHVRSHGRLITGQNPFSTRRLARLLRRGLNGEAI